MAEPEAAAPEEKAENPSPEEDRPKGLYAKLLHAQRAAGSVEKKGENDQHKYKYVKAEDVIRSASATLTDAGLIALIEGYDLETREGQSKSGNRTVECTARGKLIIVDPDSGDRIDFPIIGTGTDTPGDKAIYKAITGGLKYAWGQALTLAFGDDPEDSSSPGAQGAAEQRAKGDSGPPFGPALKDTDKPFILGEAALLLTVSEDGPDRETAKVVLAEVAEKCGGYFPVAAAHALNLMANKLRELDPKLAEQDKAQREEREAAAKAAEEEKAEEERTRSEADVAHAAAEAPQADPAEEPAEAAPGELGDPPPPEADDEPKKTDD